MGAGERGRKHSFLVSKEEVVTSQHLLQLIKTRGEVATEGSAARPKSDTEATLKNFWHYECSTRILSSG